MIIFNNHRTPRNCIIILIEGQVLLHTRENPWSQEDEAEMQETEGRKRIVPFANTEKCNKSWEFKYPDYYE